MVEDKDGLIKIMVVLREDNNEESQVIGYYDISTILPEYRHLWKDDLCAKRIITLLDIKTGKGIFIPNNGRIKFIMVM